MDHGIGHNLTTIPYADNCSHLNLTIRQRGLNQGLLVCKSYQCKVLCTSPSWPKHLSNDMFVFFCSEVIVVICNAETIVERKRAAIWNLAERLNSWFSKSSNLICWEKTHFWQSYVPFMMFRHVLYAVDILFEERLWNTAHRLF